MGNDSHLGPHFLSPPTPHTPMTVWTNFYFPNPWRLNKKFGSNQPEFLQGGIQTVDQQTKM